MTQTILAPRLVYGREHDGDWMIEVSIVEVNAYGSVKKSLYWSREKFSWNGTPKENAEAFATAMIRLGEAIRERAGDGK